MYCRTDACHAHQIMRVSLGSESSAAVQTIQLIAVCTWCKFRSMATASELRAHSVAQLALCTAAQERKQPSSRGGNTGTVAAML